jgi:adenylyltransferase/sulfurtransferase
MKSISAQELRQWREAGKPFLLVDVREEHERTSFHIGGLHLPMSEGGDDWKALQQELPVVVYCAKGIRSAIFIQRLEHAEGMPPMYNLQGGLKSWDADSHH